MKINMFPGKEPFQKENCLPFPSNLRGFVKGGKLKKTLVGWLYDGYQYQNTV